MADAWRGRDHVDADEETDDGHLYDTLRRGEQRKKNTTKAALNSTG
ncbi:hypothetical protein RSPO_m01662 (plasmid) [Ralstonia solanacearum Po82]|uniref:Uncharacterized protein n=1 Tax=Ralstonia solanacearum (strain Po82) TaxID=1031711 RepID=F6GBT9_RALS8|nr:hypothetical protein RSPO_m01662 [Ralstonia solanacearum Po82]